MLVGCILFYVIELPRSAGAVLMGAGPTFVGNPEERKCYYASGPVLFMIVIKTLYLHIKCKL